jgi:hydroxyacylglutathione hydrolase
VGQEKEMNWAAQLHDRTEFVERMLADLPERPAYFGFDVGVNLRGATPFGGLAPLRALTEAEVRESAAAGAAIIDTRSAPFFGAGHFPGSLNIGLGSALFSTWVGFIVPGGTPIALVVGSADAAAKARLELARIGFDDVRGYIEADALKEKRQLSQLSVCDLKSSLKRGDAPLVLDVRTPGEWQAGHIETAKHLSLPTLIRRLEEVPKDRPVAVVCGSGYRSTIAASLLLHSGRTRLFNVMGGMGAYAESKCPEMAPSELVFASDGI